jgi:hypothetical protein
MMRTAVVLVGFSFAAALAFAPGPAWDVPRIPDMASASEPFSEIEEDPNHRVEK